LRRITRGLYTDIHSSFCFGPSGLGRWCWGILAASYGSPLFSLPLRRYNPCLQSQPCQALFTDSCGPACRLTYKVFLHPDRAVEMHVCFLSSWPGEWVWIGRCRFRRRCFEFVEYFIGRRAKEFSHFFQTRLSPRLLALR